MRRLLTCLILILFASGFAFASDPRLSAMGDVRIGVSGSSMQSYPNPASVFFGQSQFTFAIRGRVSDTLGVSAVPYLPNSDLNGLFVADLITMGIELSFESVNPTEKDDGHHVDLIQHTSLNVNLAAGYGIFSIGVGINGGSSQQRLDVPMSMLWDFPVQSVFAPFDRVVNSEFIQVDVGMMFKFGQFSVGLMLDDVLDNSGASTTMTWTSLLSQTGVGVYWSRQEYSSRGKANSFIYSFAFDANGTLTEVYEGNKRSLDLSFVFNGGAELTYRMVRDSSMSLRVGYKAASRELAWGIITAGLGVSIRKLEFALNASIPTSSEEHVNVAAYMTVHF